MSNGSMMTMIRRFLRDESGAAAIEYGLMAVLFVLGIIGAWTKMGNSLSELFTDTANMFNNKVGG